MTRNFSFSTKRPSYYLFTISTMEATPTSTTCPNEALKNFYAKSIEKGRGIHRKFGIIILAVPKPSPGQLCELYQVETGIMRPCKSLHKTLLDSNCSTENFLYVDVQNKDDIFWSRAFYSNHSHGNDGVIVAAENFKELDKNVSGKTLFPSEGLWQSYLMATEATGPGPANLKLIIRYCVVNAATLSIIRHAEEKSTCTGLKSPDLGGRIYHRQDAGYFAILGSPNGANTARMLLDHSSEIGFRKIDKVEVLACGDVEQMENPKQSRTIAIFLTDPIPKRASRIGKPTFCSGRPRRQLALKSQ